MHRPQPRPQPPKKSGRPKRQLCPADWEDTTTDTENPDWLVGAY